MTQWIKTLEQTRVRIYACLYACVSASVRLVYLILARRTKNADHILISLSLIKHVERLCYFDYSRLIQISLSLTSLVFGLS